METTEAKEWNIVSADDLSEGKGENLSRFLQSFKPSEDDPVWSGKYYDWKIKQNPVRSGFVDLAVSGDLIVSSVTVTPKPVWYKGEKVAAGEIGDTYTHPQFQRRGILVALINNIKVRAHNSGLSLIYGLPNEQSRPAYEKKCNFLSHPHLRLATATCLFNAVKIAADKIRWLPRPAFIVFNGCVNLFLKTLQGFWIIAGKLTGLSVTLAERPDPGHDDLWERCKQQNEASLIRDRSYLQFRFFDHPLAKYRFYEARKNGVLQGYLVSRSQKAGGRMNGIIADWFYDRRSPLIFLALLNRTLREGFHDGVDLYTTWVNGSRAEKWLLRLSGFLIRKNQPLIIHRNPAGQKILDCPDRWHFTVADSDNA